MNQARNRCRQVKWISCSKMCPNGQHVLLSEANQCHHMLPIVLPVDAAGGECGQLWAAQALLLQSR